MKARAAIALVTIAAACSSAPTSPRAPDPAPKSAPTNALRYDVTATNGGRELSIEASIPAGSGDKLVIEDARARFVRDAAAGAPSAAAPLKRAEAGGLVAFSLPPSCAREGCSVRYRFALDEAARDMNDPIQAARVGPSIVAPPSTWLVRPAEHHEREASIHVRTDRSITFVSGLSRGEGGAYKVPAEEMDLLPFSAFGPLRVRASTMANMQVDVAVLPGEPFDLSDDALVNWVLEAIELVHGQYHYDFPPHLAVLIAPASGRGVGYGRTLGYGGASIFMPVGVRSEARDLMGGWEMVHEMVHVVFPHLAREHRWLAEGVATYMEALIRMRRRLVTREETFAKFRRRMAFGLPARGDGGLDGTESWGRIYWGGALFCLIADVEIRRRTENVASLDVALMEVLKQGGDVTKRWDIAQVIAVGDGATGATVLADLYRKLAHEPVPIDINRLWKLLGVAPKGDSVVFEEQAPLAPILRAILDRSPTRIEGIAREPTVMP